MLAKCFSGAISGVDAQTVEIEVFSSIATSSFTIVGLPDGEGGKGSRRHSD